MSLIQPHGGVLVDRVDYAANTADCKLSIEIDNDQLLNLEQIATGVFSPLTGFLSKRDFETCVQNMKLDDGTLWPIPIILTVSKDEFDLAKKSIGQTCALQHKKTTYGTIVIEECYTIDLKDSAQKIFGTADQDHPGVKKWLDQTTYVVAGAILQTKPRPKELQEYSFTPRDTRKLFAEKNWNTVCGFQTRNVPHRGHENLQRAALQQCDGVFIQPLIGWRKKGDFKPEAIVRAYNVLIEKYYEPNTALLGTLSTAMFYAGPKEAIYHAIIRKNYGCTHFIVGRDHAGVKVRGKSFYAMNDAIEMMKKIETELKMTTLTVDTLYYYHEESDQVKENLTEEQQKKTGYQLISGTSVREHLYESKKCSPSLLRPEVASALSGGDLIE